MSPPPTLPPASTPAPVTIQTMHTAGNTAALTIHEPLTTLARGHDPRRADEPAIADAVDLITHPAGETTALTTHESIIHELSSPQLLQPHRDAALWLAQSTAVTTTRGSARSETHNFWCVACQLWLNSGRVLIFSCITSVIPPPPFIPSAVSATPHISQTRVHPVFLAAQCAFHHHHPVSRLRVPMQQWRLRAVTRHRYITVSLPNPRLALICRTHTRPMHR